MTIEQTVRISNLKSTNHVVLDTIIFGSLLLTRLVVLDGIDIQNSLLLKGPLCQLFDELAVARLYSITWKLMVSSFCSPSARGILRSKGHGKEGTMVQDLLIVAVLLNRRTEELIR